MGSNSYTLTEAQLKAITEIIRRGDRVELIPVKDGVTILEIKRREIKTE